MRGTAYAALTHSPSQHSATTHHNCFFTRAVAYTPHYKTPLRSDLPIFPKRACIAWTLRSPAPTESTS